MSNYRMGAFFFESVVTSLYLFRVRQPQLYSSSLNFTPGEVRYVITSSESLDSIFDGEVRYVHCQ